MIATPPTDFSTEDYREFLYRVPVGLIAFRDDGVIEMINPMASNLLIPLLATIRLNNIYDAMQPLCPDLEMTVSEFDGRSGTVINQRRLQGQTRKRYVTLQFTVTRVKPGLLVALLEDVTELREVEDQLRQAQKMEVVGQLTRGLADDFNNIVTSVMVGLDEVGRTIDSVHADCQRASGVVGRLMDFSRQQHAALLPVSANATIVGMQTMVRQGFGAGIEFKLDLDAGLWLIWSDQNQLESALLNLAINAGHAMPKGGRLTISTTNVVVDEAKAAMVGVEPGDYVRISVDDTGVGMSSDVMARAFEPFFTTRPAGTGSGLGLSMIAGFALQTGGRALIDSTEDEGTTVTLYLPRLPVGQAAPALASVPSALIPGGSATHAVLLVEDEHTIRKLLANALRRVGYDVQEAADGEAALQIVHSGARIDLLISDFGLPNGLNGHGLAQAARGFMPSLKVLFISGFMQQFGDLNGNPNQWISFMQKPFTTRDFLMRVAGMLSES